jgi:hypothetical protein
MCGEIRRKVNTALALSREKLSKKFQNNLFVNRMLQKRYKTEQAPTGVRAGQ